MGMMGRIVVVLLCRLGKGSWTGRFTNFVPLVAGVAGEKRHWFPWGQRRARGLLHKGVARPQGLLRKRGDRAAVTETALWRTSSQCLVLASSHALQEYVIAPPPPNPPTDTQAQCVSHGMGCPWHGMHDGVMPLCQPS